jgi:calcineurin-like phosphoesterase family protein
VRSTVLPGFAFVLIVMVVRAGLASQPQNSDESVVLVGAGDIANCEMLGGARATAALLDQIEGTIFTLGDHAYPRGTAQEFKDCYEPTWGRHKARTRPALGNHDILTLRGRPYFDYFGDAAGPSGRGYYSYDLGAWHIISLNGTAVVEARSPQAEWLREDLDSHPTDCVLAYWHMPLFSSGPHGGTPEMREVWKILYEKGADVVVNSHDHVYERFAPLNANGKPDPERGMRLFLVGTGGGGVYKLKKVAQYSEVQDNSTYGVLKFTLNKGNYAWQFIPMAGQKFTDSGSAPCSVAK